MSDNYNSYYDKSYRFISLDSLFKTIESKSLRFTRVDSFNDPLDNSPFLMNFNWNEFSDLDPRLLARANKATFEKALSSMYVCCFSKYYNDETSYLLWSHYGDYHKGVSFEIDFSKFKYLGGPSEVKYPEDLAEQRNKISKKNGEQALFIAINKTNVWNYENEVRLICDSTHEKISQISKASDDKRHLYVDFNIEFISKVVFGCMVHEDKVADTILLFKNKNHIPVFEQMVINPVTLKINPRKLNLNI